jgi:hypothetical protein
MRAYKWNRTNLRTTKFRQAVCEFGIHVTGVPCTHDANVLAFVGVVAVVGIVLWVVFRNAANKMKDDEGA